MAASSDTLPSFSELCQYARELQKRRLAPSQGRITGGLREEGSDIFPEEYGDYTYAYLLAEAQKIERKLYAEALASSQPGAQPALHGLSLPQPPPPAQGEGEGRLESELHQLASPHYLQPEQRDEAQIAEEASPRSIARFPGIKMPALPFGAKKAAVPSPPPPGEAQQKEPGLQGEGTVPLAPAQMPAPPSPPKAAPPSLPYQAKAKPPLPPAIHEEEEPPLPEAAEIPPLPSEGEPAKEQAPSVISSPKLSPRLRAIIEEKLRREEARKEEKVEIERPAPKEPEKEEETGAEPALEGEEAPPPREEGEEAPAPEAEAGAAEEALPPLPEEAGEEGKPTARKLLLKELSERAAKSSGRPEEAPEMPKGETLARGEKPKKEAPGIPEKEAGGMPEEKAGEAGAAGAKSPFTGKLTIMPVFSDSPGRQVEQEPPSPESSRRLQRIQRILGELKPSPRAAAEIGEEPAPQKAKRKPAGKEPGEAPLPPKSGLAGEEQPPEGQAGEQEPAQAKKGRVVVPEEKQPPSPEEPAKVPPGEGEPAKETFTLPKGRLPPAKGKPRKAPAKKGKGRAAEALPRKKAAAKAQQMKEWLARERKKAAAAPPEGKGAAVALKTGQPPKKGAPAITGTSPSGKAPPPPPKGPSVSPKPSVAFPKAPRQEEGQASQEEGEPRKQEERSEKILAAGVLQRKTIPGIPARTSPVQAQPQQPRTTPQGRILPGRVTPRIAPATYVPPARQQPRQEGKVPMRQPIAKAAEDLPPQEEGEVGQRQNKMARQMGELISGREQEAQPEGERMQRPAGQAPQQGGQPGPEKQGTPVQTEGPAPAPAQTRAEALKTKEVAGTAKMPEKEEEFPLPPPPPPEDDVPKPEDYEEAKEGLKRKMTEEEIAANARKGEDEYLEQYAKQNLVWLYEIYKMGGIAREDFLQKVRERIAEEKGAAKEEPSAQNAALANLGKEIDKNIK